MAASFQLGTRRVGGDTDAPFIIAEAGVNHEGKLDQALALIEVAARAGADAVKFQSFIDVDAVCARDATLADYQRDNLSQRARPGSQHDMVARLRLPPSSWLVLFEAARAAGLLFLSTPFDEASVELLVDLGVVGLKIPSGEVTNPFLCRKAAQSGLPLIMSTGMATHDEIASMLDLTQSHHPDPRGKICLLHCLSTYPAPLAELNLRAIAGLRESFGVPVGFSDHTLGFEASGMALGIGARVFEKHFTLSTTRKEARDKAPHVLSPDHVMSLDEDELTAFVRHVHAMDSALGSGRKICQASEKNTRSVARRSLAYAVDCAAGTTLAEHHLTALRPECGISPMRYSEFVGRTLTRERKRGAFVAQDDIN